MSFIWGNLLFLAMKRNNDLLYLYSPKVSSFMGLASESTCVSSLSFTRVEEKVCYTRQKGWWAGTLQSGTLGRGWAGGFPKKQWGKL